MPRYQIQFWPTIERFIVYEMIGDELSFIGEYRTKHQAESAIAFLLRREPRLQAV